MQLENVNVSPCSAMLIATTDPLFIYLFFTLEHQGVCRNITPPCFVAFVVSIVLFVCFSLVMSKILQ